VQLLALKKIETYITNTTHLIDEAEAMQTNAERDKFRYYALRQDVKNIFFVFIFIFIFAFIFIFIFLVLFKINSKYDHNKKHDKQCFHP
jgi:ABC-type multidrug transport system permease subunit